MAAGAGNVSTQWGVTALPTGLRKGSPVGAELVQAEGGGWLAGAGFLHHCHPKGRHAILTLTLGKERDVTRSFSPQCGKTKPSLARLRLHK